MSQRLESLKDKFVAALPASSREREDVGDWIGIITALLPILLNLCGGGRGNVRRLLNDPPKAKLAFASNSYWLAARIHDVTGEQIDADQVRQIVTAANAVIRELDDADKDELAGLADLGPRNDSGWAI